MKKLKKILLYLVGIMAGLYVLLCVSLYFFQEKLIFFPTKIEKNYIFNFANSYSEISIPTKDNVLLHGILFYAKKGENSTSKSKKNMKKLVFYLHGNGGTVSSGGAISSVYTDLGYDLFILDYRGYGKSEGKIYSQEQFFEDILAAYNFMKIDKKYKEENIIIVGYSVGTAAAAMLTSKNNPKALVLLAPYFSLIDMTKRNYPFVPSFLLKYKFTTAEFLAKTNVPTYIFHGTEDKVIPYSSSTKIKEHLQNNLKNKVSNFNFITLPHQGHNGIATNSIFLKKRKDIF